MKRRDFLAAGIGLSATSYFMWKLMNQSKSQASAKSYIVGNYSDSPDRLYDLGTNISKDVPSLLNIYDLETRLVSSVPIPCYGHSFEQSPKMPHLIGTVSKGGRWGAIVDIKKYQVEKKLEAPPGMRYYGHGIFGPEGSFYISAANEITTESEILVYEDRKWDLVGKFKAGGLGGHAMFWLKPGTLMMAHQYTLEDRRFSAITKVNVDQQKVEKTYSVPRATHLLPLTEDIVVAGHRDTFDSDSSMVLFALNHKTGQIFDPHSNIGLNPKFFVGEALGLVKVSEQAVGVSTHDGGHVLVWDLQTNNIIGKKIGKKASGLIYSNEKLYVTNGRGNLLMENVDSGTMTLSSEVEIAKGFSNTSHIAMVTL